MQTIKSNTFGMLILFISFLNLKQIRGSCALATVVLSYSIVVSFVKGIISRDALKLKLPQARPVYAKNLRDAVRSRAIALGVANECN